jgi:hypothetical protein
MQSNSLDILWGADEIGRFIGRSRRTAYWMLEKKLLPGRKIGRIWTATKSELTEGLTKVRASEASSRQ